MWADAKIFQKLFFELQLFFETFFLQIASCFFFPTNIYVSKTFSTVFEIFGAGNAIFDPPLGKR